MLKNKFFLVLAVILLIFVAYFFGKNQSLSLPTQPNTTKTEETLDAWKARWNNEANNYCEANVLSTVSPEFQRAVSLVLQRYWENESTKNALMIIRGNQPCLDIQYAASDEEMMGADGVFLFSEEYSGPKGLKIFVNPNYKLQDDLTTALLLSHELTHAEQFILQDVSKKLVQDCFREVSRSFCESLQSMNGVGFYLENTSNTCVRHEAQAYFNENIFYAVLKKVEQDNITLRARNVRTSEANLPVYAFLTQLNTLSRSCPLNTQEDTNNFVDCLSNVYVRSQPFYQKQCNL